MLSLIKECRTSRVCFDSECLQSPTMQCVAAYCRQDVQRMTVVRTSTPLLQLKAPIITAHCSLLCLYVCCVSEHKIQAYDSTGEALPTGKLWLVPM